jgi:hypothetical protein
MTDWPGESYDPLLMSLKSTWNSVDEWEQTGQKGICKPWDNWDMDCVSFRGCVTQY